MYLLSNSYYYFVYFFIHFIVFMPLSLKLCSNILYFNEQMTYVHALQKS